MKISLITKFAGAGVAVLILIAMAFPAIAQERANTGSDRREAAKERMQGRLDEARKKACEARSKAILNIVARSAAQGKKHLDTFTKISERVKQFYADKKLTISNYEQLVAAADTKKAAAEAAIQVVKDTTTFDCSGDNPVGTADAFKTKIRAMHQSLKDYRSAINELLVAVKQAGKKAEGGTQ